MAHQRIRGRGSQERHDVVRPGPGVEPCGDTGLVEDHGHPMVHGSHQFVGIAGEHGGARALPEAGDTGDRQVAVIGIAEVPGLLRAARHGLPFIEAGRGKDDPRAQQRPGPGLGRAVGTEIERLAVRLEPPAQGHEFRLTVARRDDGHLRAGRDVVPGVLDETRDEPVDEGLLGRILQGFAPPAVGAMDRISSAHGTSLHRPARA